MEMFIERYMQKSPLGNSFPLRKGKLYEVTREDHKAGDALTVVSLRSAFLTGNSPSKITLKKDRPIYRLKENSEGTFGCMMSDSPQEVYQHYKPWRRAEGRVLVGGLGLGMIARMMADKDEVEEVVVVEIEDEVIELCDPGVSKIKIKHGDINKVLFEEEEWDFVYIDTYYGTSASEYFETVLPMRLKCEKLFPVNGGSEGTPAMFWAEKEMMGQVNFSKWNLERLEECGINWDMFVELSRKLKANDLI